MRHSLLAAVFKYDTEGSVNIRRETDFLRQSRFETLEKEFSNKFQGKLDTYKPYPITGPGGQEIVIRHSPKWGGMKLFFVYKVLLGSSN